MGSKYLEGREEGVADSNCLVEPKKHTEYNGDRQVYG